MIAATSIESGRRAIPLAEVEELVEAGSIVDDTMVFSDQAGFPFETWTAWSECKHCFGENEAARTDTSHPHHEPVAVEEPKKKESRRVRKAREKQEKEAEDLKAEEAAEELAARAPIVESFGVGAPLPEGEEFDPENIDPYSAKRLKGLVRDIQLKWDGSIHFQTCTPETIVGLKDKRAAALKKKDDEDQAAMNQAERIKTREESRRLERLFMEMDDDASGSLDAAEVTELATQLGWAEPELVFAKMDVDGDGSIDVGEFRRWWLGNSQEAKAVRAEKKKNDEKISESTMMLKETLHRDDGLKGLSAGVLATLA